MPYSLVITDDEKMMRDGLTNIIQWESLGFQVDCVFADGSEVLEYLKENIIDVLMIDIKMTKVSGIEVARFIFEKKLPIKVIFLSGYKDFEYAQLAVEYDVEHYLLKPFSIPKLKELFISIRKKLDEQMQMEEEIQSRIERFQKIVDYGKEQFIVDAYMGAVANERELHQRLEIIGVESDWLQQKSLLFDISLQKTVGLQTFMHEYGTQELGDQLAHILRSFSKRVEFFLLEFSDNTLKGLYLEKVGTDSLRQYWQEGRAIFEKHIEDLIKMMLDLEVKVEVLCPFHNTKSLLHYHHNRNRSQGKTHIEKEMQFIHDLREQKKLLMTYAIQGNLERALPLFSSFVGQTGVAGIDFTKNQINHFLLTFIEKACSRDCLIAEQLLEIVDIAQLYGLSTEDKMIRWGLEKVREIVGFLKDKSMLYDDNDHISSIKRYIAEHYSKDITLSDIGDLVCMNPIYISRVFKERTGQTFTEYLTKERIRAAAHYLDTTSHYVYEISEMVGYNDIKHFYKTFKRMMGYSPKDYRQRGDRSAKEKGEGL